MSDSTTQRPREYRVYVVYHALREFQGSLEAVAELDPDWYAYAANKPCVPAIAKKCADCGGLQVLEEHDSVTFVMASRIVKLVMKEVSR